MVSLNNLQTCLACLWQRKEDYSKLSGDVNKNNSIDVVWNGTLYVSTYFNLVFFTPLWGNLLILQCHLGDCVLDIQEPGGGGTEAGQLSGTEWNPSPMIPQRNFRDQIPHIRCTGFVCLFVKGWSSYLSDYRYTSKLKTEAWYSSREYSRIQLKSKISAKVWKAFMSSF